MLAPKGSKKPRKPTVKSIKELANSGELEATRRNSRIFATESAVYMRLNAGLLTVKLKWFAHRVSKLLTGRAFFAESFALAIYQARQDSIEHISSHHPLSEAEIGGMDGLAFVFIERLINREWMSDVSDDRVYIERAKNYYTALIEGTIQP